MSVSISKSTQSKIIYPDCDGEPMSDNTLQFQWIVTIKENLSALFANRPDVFVAGDLLWYPVEGDPKTRTAPDAMVVFGRPQGYRGSYKQWEEGGIAPQVVFEVLSPGNRTRKMLDKFKFYERFGVLEYYIYDPMENELTGCQRIGVELAQIEQIERWTSPLLGIRFECSGEELKIYRPDGERFRTFLELAQERDSIAQERDSIAQERDSIAQERDSAIQELEKERQRIRELEAKLRDKEDLPGV